ncbi:hypothetical protein [Streptomyces halobius]|uniref:Uncharacterized protein n=1 Tax=Streptomyces halobius TaxID=2879846 RepID=A0ABY4MHC6_9ACTN|nr:hypothetical protein [Streptomyces halobius]UQA95731.1 hypothetical protein K9S39_31145 [Streptomyces halobius]
MKSRSTFRARPNHPAAATAARARRGQWVLAVVYPNRASAQSAVRRIPHADRIPSYEPAGSFEAYEAQHEDGTAVWVRYVGGDGPAPAPMPETVSYRVANRGSGGDYVGVWVTTVMIAAVCPVCGGPRGEAVPYRFCEDGEWYSVDRWSNPCGHVDTYAAVLAEHRARQQDIEEKDQEDATRAVTGPADAGEYTDTVRLLNEGAANVRGLHAKQAVTWLARNGHEEAARRIQEELTARHGHMSARQAAVFLTELAADRAACAACEDGRINYQARDGEYVSLRCPNCRRDVVSLA